MLKRLLETDHLVLFSKQLLQKQGRQ